MDLKDLKDLTAEQLEKLLVEVENEKIRRFRANPGDVEAALSLEWMAWARKLGFKSMYECAPASPPASPAVMRGDDPAPRPNRTTPMPAEEKPGPKTRFSCTLERPSEREPGGVIAEADYSIAGDTVIVTNLE